MSSATIPFRVGVVGGLVALAVGVGLGVWYGGGAGDLVGDARGGDGEGPRLRALVLQPPDASRLTAAGMLRPASMSDEDAGEPEPASSEGMLRCRAGDGPQLCVHGSEPPPPGVDPDDRPSVAELEERRFSTTEAGPNRGPEETATVSEVVTPEVVATGARVPCVGDGRSGPRVQAVYAHAADVPSRYTEVLSLVRQYAADVSDRLNYAAGRAGAGRLLRFVTSGSPCVLAVDNVTLDRTGDDSFANTVAELRARGYDRPDRKYLVWVDAAVGICGLAHVYQDDRPTSDNRNAQGNMFARVDASCWGYGELHEVLHTLGAVQDSSSHSTGAGHCYDESDTMCYEDTSGRSMSQVCRDAPAWNVDCELDDYFHPSPPPGSYLATHWNVADSPYLQGASAPPPLPEVEVTSVARAFAGNAWSVRADPRMPGGRTVSALRWTTTRSDCRFARPAARTTTYWCPVTAAGAGRVRVWLKDSEDLETTDSVEYRLSVPAQPRRTSMSLRSSTTSVQAGGTAVLRGALTDPVSRKNVIGMPVSLYRRLEGRSGWQKLATTSTDPAGAVSFLVRPTRTTDYQVVSGYTRTWASAPSGTVRRVTVLR